MSRDGYLPPGCTQQMCDEAVPGYWDESDEIGECSMKSVEQAVSAWAQELVGKLSAEFADVLDPVPWLRRNQDRPDDGEKLKQAADEIENQRKMIRSLIEFRGFMQSVITATMKHQKKRRRKRHAT